MSKFRGTFQVGGGDSFVEVNEAEDGVLMFHSYQSTGPLRNEYQSAHVGLTEQEVAQLVEELDSWLIGRRIDRMSPEDVNAQLRAAGIDPKTCTDRVKTLITKYMEVRQ